MSEPSETPSPVNMKEGRRQARTAREEKKRLRKDERGDSKKGRSRNGTFVQKGGKNFFGFKQRSSHGVDIPMIREFVITGVSVRDSRVVLSIPGIPCHRYSGYQGALCRYLNATMDRASRNAPLTVEHVRRNLRISGKRTPGERPYSVIKREQNGGHTSVTMVRRVRIGMSFANMTYNLSTVLYEMILSIPNSGSPYAILRLLSFIISFVRSMNAFSLAFSKDDLTNSSTAMEDARSIMDLSSTDIPRSLFLYVSSYFPESVITGTENFSLYSCISVSMLSLYVLYSDLLITKVRLILSLYTFVKKIKVVDANEITVRNILAYMERVVTKFGSEAEVDWPTYVKRDTVL